MSSGAGDGTGGGTGGCEDKLRFSRRPRHSATTRSATQLQQLKHEQKQHLKHEHQRRDLRI